MRCSMQRLLSDVAPDNRGPEHQIILVDWVVQGPPFFLVGARSKIHSALVSCIFVDHGLATRGADGVVGVSPWRFVARCLLNILSAMRFDETLSVVYAASPSG